MLSVGSLLTLLISQAHINAGNMNTTKALSTNTSAKKNDYSNIREAYIDAQIVIMSSKAGQDAQKEMQSKQEAHAKKFEKAQQEFMKAQKDLEAKGSTLSAEVQAKERKKIAKMESDARALLEEIKEEIQTDVYKKTELLDKDLKAAAAQFAQQNNIDVIKDKGTGGALFVSDRLDCSDDLIKIFDKNYTSQNTKKPATTKQDDKKSAGTK